MTADADHVRRLLGHAELDWIVQRAGRRLELGQPLKGSIVLSSASQAQRRAVERLLGRPVAPGHALSVRLGSVELMLQRAGAATDLRSAIESLTGPVLNRRAAGSAAERAWAAAFAPLEAISARRPGLGPWLASVRSTGLLRRLARGDPAAALELAEAATRIIDRLPCRAMPLSVLASSVTGDGHSLDAGRPLSSLVIRAAGLVGNVPEGGGAEWRRTVWASVGVLSGELTSPVLCLNLPVRPTTTAGRALASWAEVGQPVYLTARQLLRDPPPFPPLYGRCVYICENPTVVAEAANVVGAACAPLVCASGHPAGAATVLLRQLAESGADLRYHGDFDWPGITIANGLVARFGVGSWQFDAAAYRAAAGCSGRPKLRGRPVQAIWDAELTEAMLALDQKIEEEQVLPSLLDDLAQAR